MEKNINTSINISDGTGDAFADLAIQKDSGGSLVASSKPVAKAPVDDRNEVKTLGRYEDTLGYVPVFATRRGCFMGRDQGSTDGIVMKLAVGDKVHFEPFRDWGVGFIMDGDEGEIIGWVDRACIAE